MPLGMMVGLGLRDIVLDGNPATAELLFIIVEKLYGWSSILSFWYLLARTEM